MTITLHKWTSADKVALMALCNAVDRTFLSDRLPYPYTEADADCWLEMVAENECKEGVWRSIWGDGQLVGSISVERKNEGGKTTGEIGYMILTPFWSQGIGTEAVRQICEIAFQEMALEQIIGQVFPENIATNTPDAYAQRLPLFADLLHDSDDKVRMEAPEMFRVMGKRRPQIVVPYLSILQELSENDSNPVVRIHCAGAIRITSTQLK